MGAVDMESDQQREKRRGCCPPVTICCVLGFVIVILLLLSIGVVVGFFVGDIYGTTVHNFILNSNGTESAITDNNAGNTAGGMEAWAQWGTCSVTCGGGTRSRARQCASGACATETQNCYSQTCPTCQFTQSLTGNVQQSAPAGGVSWLYPLNPVGGTGTCSHRGVLKMVPPASATKLHVYMSLSDAKQWSFNLAEDKTVNGWGGGSTSNPWVAEIHNVEKSLLMYGNVAWKAVAGPPVPSLVIRNYFPEQPSQLHITVSKTNPVDIRLITDTETQHLTMKDHHMFRFQDQFYLGINRVVSTSSRQGTGLCNVCIVWE